MKFRTYWVIMQPPTVVPLALVGLAAAGAFNWLAPLASHRTGEAPFVALTLLGPFFAGCIISHTFHAPLHRPFSITLPNLSRNSLQWHIPTLALFALLLSYWAHLGDASLPQPVAASVAFAGLCLMLPFEAGLRWYGSSKLLFAITSIVLLGTLWANETRAVLLFLPALTVVGSLALATLCCRLTFDRNRLRKRARTPLSSMAETPSAETEQRQTMADTPRLGRSWTHGLIGNSTFNLIRAVLHETYGYPSGWAISLAKFSAYIVIVVPAVAYVFSLLSGFAGPRMPFGRLLYQLIWEPHPVEAGQAGIKFTVLLPIVFVMTVARSLPRPQNFYSISRGKRARLVFIVSLLQVGAQLLAGSGALVAISWFAALLAGYPFQPFIAPDFMVEIIALAPFIPAMLWVNVFARVRSQKRYLADMTVWVGAFALAATFSSNTTWRNWLLSPAGLSSAALLLAVSLYAYRAALLYFYRHSDLLRKMAR